jgi:BlaI family transcriptional regulator, penicillinase repressor
LNVAITSATIRSIACYSKSMTENPTDLGDLEREVMQLLLGGGPMASEAVREQLPRKLKQLTVRTVLRRLEDKGFVTHSVAGRTYVFEASERRRDVAARAVRRIVDWLCNGSVEEMLVGMVDKDMLDSAQLQNLATRLARAKQGRT